MVASSATGCLPSPVATVEAVVLAAAGGLFLAGWWVALRAWQDEPAGDPRRRSQAHRRT